MDKFSKIGKNKIKKIQLNNRVEIENTVTYNVTPQSKFLSKIFESREMAHVYHLKVTGDGSYATHKALQDYYDEVLELIDTFVEIYQGQYGIVGNYEMINSNISNKMNSIEYFTELTTFIKSERYNAFDEEDSHLHNIIDEIVTIIYRTLYKLKYLK